MKQVTLFPLPPFGFRFHIRIAAAFDDARSERRAAALVFDCIMQECCDCFIFCATVFEYETCYGQKMGHIGDLSSFAQL